MKTKEKKIGFHLRLGIYQYAENNHLLSEIVTFSSQIFLLLTIIVRPFTMSRALPPAFGYYGLCWLLTDHLYNYSYRRFSLCTGWLPGSLASGRQYPGAPGVVLPVPSGQHCHNADTKRMSVRSPRIRMWTFPAQTHHLLCPLGHTASLSCANSPSGYDVSVRRLAVLLQASFRPILADSPLPFANSSRQIFLDGDLPVRDSHSINSHPCRTYTIKSSRMRTAIFVAVWLSNWDCSDLLRKSASRFAQLNLSLRLSKKHLRSKY